MAVKTQASVEAMLDATGEAFLADTTVTFAATTSLVKFVPVEGDFTEGGTNTPDFTVDVAAGTITCNFTGTVGCSVEGSLTSSTNIDIVGHFFVDAVDQMKGFERDISNFGKLGSVSAPAEGVAVTSGQVISFHISVSAGTPTITFHDYAMKIKRVT